MTSTDRHGVSPDDRRTLVIVTLVAATFSALFVVLPVDFVLNYFMNDMVRPGDHVRFLAYAAVAAVGLTALYTVCVSRVTQLSFGRSALGCSLVTVSVFLCVGAGYLALSLSPALDTAVGAEWSDALCVTLAPALGATALGAFAAGRRALSLR